MWRARLLAWSGDLPAAELQYRNVLRAATADGDVLLGLADVQLWRGEFSDALVTLEQAEGAKADASEVLRRRARALNQLHRSEDAARVYLALLRLVPSDAEAIRALSGLRKFRHEVRVGSDTDTFNYTGAANAESIAFMSRWNERWTTHVIGSLYQRFGQKAEKLNLGATYRLTPTNWVTADAGVGNRQDVAPEEEANFEYGHGFRLRWGPIHGVESYAEQRNLWYSTSHVTIIGTTQVFYLPHDWMWAIGVNGVRTAFPSTRTDWVAAGFSRLTVPITARLTANAVYAVGAESYSKIDQIGRFSAHTITGGVRVSLNSRQDLYGYVAFQNRTQNRTQTSLGVSYGLRF